MALGAASKPQSPIPDAIVCDLGRQDYHQTWALQRRLQGALIAAKRGGPPAPQVILFVEHPPVFTLGPSGDNSNVLFDHAALAERGASFVRTDRGGDVTFHGPGQIVAYPILDLERVHYTDGSRGTDIHRYLRTLEEAVAEVCTTYDVHAGRVAGRTGVWVGPDARGPERKICAMGIRCSRWVTMHGLAFNVNTDLAWFDMIVPCGIADRGVTSLAAECEAPVDEAVVRLRLAERLLHALGMQGERVEADELVARIAPA